MAYKYYSGCRTEIEIHDSNISDIDVCEYLENEYPGIEVTLKEPSLVRSEKITVHSAFVPDGHNLASMKQIDPETGKSLQSLGAQTLRSRIAASVKDKYN